MFYRNVMANDTFFAIVYYWATVTINGSPYATGSLSCVSVCPVCESVCNVGVLWPHGRVDEDASWYGCRPRPRLYVMLDGDPALPRRKGAQQPPPHFSAHVYCGQTVAHLSNC